MVWWCLAGVALPAGQGHWASDKEVKTPVDGSDRQKGHQSFQESSLLSKLAETPFLFA
jgi:hypothetical protein